MPRQCLTRMQERMPRFRENVHFLRSHTRGIFASRDMPDYGYEAWQLLQQMDAPRHALLILPPPTKSFPHRIKQQAINQLPTGSNNTYNRLIFNKLYK